MWLLGSPGGTEETSPTSRQTPTAQPKWEFLLLLGKQDVVWQTVLCLLEPDNIWMAISPSASSCSSSVKIVSIKDVQDNLMEISLLAFQFKLLDGIIQLMSCWHINVLVYMKYLLAKQQNQLSYSDRRQAYTGQVTSHSHIYTLGLK